MVLSKSSQYPYAHYGLAASTLARTRSLVTLG